MSEAFDKLKELLEEQGTLSNDDVEKMTKEHGDITDEEKMWLESEKLKKERDKEATITMDQYLEATKILDTAEEGSDEYKKAEAIVEKFESGG